MEKSQIDSSVSDMSVSLQAVTSEFVHITPIMAKEWLDKSGGHNRDFRAGNCKAFAQAMARGKFILNGEPIVFDKDGNILDGQHRLRACIGADVSFDSLVVRGISPAARHTFDTGANRSIADDLTISTPAFRIINRRIGATLTLIMKYCSRNMPPYFKTVPAKRDILDANPAIAEAAAKVQVIKDMIVGASILGALYYLGGLGYPEKTEIFIRQVTDGHNLKEGDPADTLRSHLIGVAKRARSSRTRMDNWDVFRTMCPAFNRFVKDEPIRHLVIPAKPVILGADPKVISHKFGMDVE